eukprot:6042200-Alexandrium_andersonii.AAC.1
MRQLPTSPCGGCRGTRRRRAQHALPGPWASLRSAALPAAEEATRPWASLAPRRLRMPKWVRGSGRSRTPHAGVLRTSRSG